MSRVTREQTEYVAKLARLKLSDQELDRMTRDLDAILGHVQTLASLDTDEVPPTRHGVSLSGRYRADEVGEELDTELALSQAPERLGRGFGVPKIIE